MGVMTVLLAATHAFLEGGVRFYQDTVQGIEVQQQALVGITHMAKALDNTNFDKILVDGDSIIFPSNVSANGEFLRTDSGVPLWASFICFTPATGPKGDLLVRKMDEVFGPDLDGDGTPDRVDYPPDPLRPPDPVSTTGPARDEAFFAGRPSVSVLCRNLDTFVAEKETDAIVLNLAVRFSSNRTSDRMQISTRVFPKN